MFTGIVSEQGQVSNISKHKGFLSLRIKTSENIQRDTLNISFPKDKLYLFDKNKKRIRQ